MTLEDSPQQGRPTMSARDAARALRVDHRTVQKMIESGELAGGAKAGTKQRRWYVYVDQIHGTAPPPTDLSEVAALRVELNAARAATADLQAQLNSTQETNRLLLAGQAQLRASLADAQRALADSVAAGEAFREAADAYRRGAEGYGQVIERLQSSAVQITDVADNYADALSQYNTPGHLGELIADQP